MSKNLFRIEKILAENQISACYLAATKESPLAQLSLELPFGEENLLSLELCEIPMPDSNVFILQSFVPLPLPAPFEEDDLIPEFLVSGTQNYIAHLNQVLPIVGLNCSGQRIYFRTTLTLGTVSEEELLYFIELVHNIILRILPSLQAVAIGMQEATQAIQSIDSLFLPNEEE